ncbi:armadillo-type protein [Aspergillus nidulans var. acristatus]
MTVITGHQRKAQSNGGSTMQPSALNERTRGAHGRISSGLSGNSSWGMSDIWKNNMDDSVARSTIEGISGSSSLLPSSESDGWDIRRNVPWPSRAQGNGMATSPVQNRTNDLGAAALVDGNDTSSYYTQSVSSTLGPSPGTGQVTYLDSGSERISPAGETNAMGNRVLYNNNDRRSVGLAGTAGTAAYQAQSGFATPLDSARSEHKGAMSMSSMQTLADNIHRGHIRNGYAHSSHNSTSNASQRPNHAAFPSFCSDTPFPSRYGSNPTELSTSLERMQMSETPNATSRPPYVSHASLDTSLSRLRHQVSRDEDSYQAAQGYGNEFLSQNPALAYQIAQSPHIRERDIVTYGDYPVNGAYYNGRPTGSNSGSRYRNGFANNAQENQLPGLQGRLREDLPMESPYQVSHMLARQRQFTPAYDYGYQSPAALASIYPVAQLNATALTTRLPSREHGSQESWGPVLADFRLHGKNKRFELKDIYGHIVEFSGDQYGSRFLQQKIETANSDEKDRVFREILPNFLQLAQDIFGNYVAQKLYEHGNQTQKKMMTEDMRSKVVKLSLSPYGCRVVQKALEHVLTDQQAWLVREIQPQVLECVESQHGNHVIQKVFEYVPTQYTKGLVDSFRGQVERQSTHSYGCRVIQRMLEFCEDVDRRFILAEIRACAPRLIEDQYGNYVIQHIIQSGEEEDRSFMIEMVKQKLLWYSKHKFASNVVEKSIEFGNEAQRRDIIARLTAKTEAHETQLIELMADQYGNYVFQKVLGHLSGVERAALVERIKPLLVHLKKSNCGKQIAAIEKLIGDSSPTPNPAIPASNHASSTTPPNSHKSSPQPVKRAVEERFVATPPTPPPTDNQSNGDGTAVSAELTGPMQ